MLYRLPERPEWNPLQSVSNNNKAEEMVAFLNSRKREQESL